MIAGNPNAQANKHNCKRNNDMAGHASRELTSAQEMTASMLVHNSRIEAHPPRSRQYLAAYRLHTGETCLYSADGPKAHWIAIAKHAGLWQSVPATMKKKVAIGVALAATGIVLGCLEAQKGSQTQQSGLLYRHHFIGAAQIASGTNATKLKEVFALPSSTRVATNLATKLANASKHLWGKNVAANAKGGADLLSPLIEDMAVSESYVAVKGPVARAEWVFAINVPQDRGSIWDKNLKALAKNWKLGNPADKSFDRFKGWEIKRSDAPNRFQVVHAGNWVLLGLGNGDLTLLPKLLQAASKNGRPVEALKADALLSLEADTPRLVSVLPVLAPLKFPPVALSVFGRGENLRTEAKIRSNITWKYEPWKIPTNSLSEPIVSFTAAQGIRQALENAPWVKELGLKTLPNQLCAWGLGNMPWQTFVSIPVQDATNTIQQIAPTLPRIMTKHFGPLMGRFVWASNRAEFLWQEIPAVVPHIRPLHEQGQDYIYFAVFPRPATNAPPPAELLAQLGTRKNLAYYDWEFTGERLAHGWQFYQLYNIFTFRMIPSERAPAQMWLHDLAKLLGNTITEVTVAQDKQLDLVRKSHVGFTGFELATLALWFDSPGFPFQIDPQPKPPANPPVRKPATNAPAKTE